VFRAKINQGLDELEVDVAHLVEKRQGLDVQIVDCREPDEWNAGHLEGSSLIPLDLLAFRKGELNPTRPVVIACRSGSRSLLAAKMLQASGFQDAKSLAGGLIAWVNSGHKLVQ
jgi:rhodanese-related sulfurtransferase